MQAKAQQTGSTNAPVLGIVQENGQNGRTANAKRTSQGSIIPTRAELTQAAQAKAQQAESINMPVVAAMQNVPLPLAIQNQRVVGDAAFGVPQIAQNMTSPIPGNMPGRSSLIPTKTDLAQRITEAYKSKKPLLSKNSKILPDVAPQQGALSLSFRSEGRGHNPLADALLELEQGGTPSVDVDSLAATGTDSASSFTTGEENGIIENTENVSKVKRTEKSQKQLSIIKRNSEGDQRNAISINTPGAFEIDDWTGYPDAQKPKGPFIIIEGDEYEFARKIANQTNSNLHKKYNSIEGLQIHELHPVKFGGNPSDIGNKIVVTPKEHAKYTVFWNRVLQEQRRNK